MSDLCCTSDYSPLRLQATTGESTPSKASAAPLSPGGTNTVARRLARTGTTATVFGCCLLYTSRSLQSFCCTSVAWRNQHCRQAPRSYRDHCHCFRLLSLIHISQPPKLLLHLCRLAEPTLSPGASLVQGPLPLFSVAVSYTHLAASKASAAPLSPGGTNTVARRLARTGTTATVFGCCLLYTSRSLQSFCCTSVAWRNQHCRQAPRSYRDHCHCFRLLSLIHISQPPKLLLHLCRLAEPTLSPGASLVQGPLPLFSVAVSYTHLAASKASAAPLSPGGTNTVARRLARTGTTATVFGCCLLYTSRSLQSFCCTSVAWRNQHCRQAPRSYRDHCHCFRLLSLIHISQPPKLLLHLCRLAEPTLSPGASLVQGPLPLFSVAVSYTHLAASKASAAPLSPGGTNTVARRLARTGTTATVFGCCLLYTSRSLQSFCCTSVAWRNQHCRQAPRSYRDHCHCFRLLSLIHISQPPKLLLHLCRLAEPTLSPGASLVQGPLPLFSVAVSYTHLAASKASAAPLSPGGTNTVARRLARTGTTATVFGCCLLYTSRSLQSFCCTSVAWRNQHCRQAPRSYRDHCHCFRLLSLIHISQPPKLLLHLCRLAEPTLSPGASRCV
ncbi:hypothetical protein DEO72_LG9g1256 [Vigna unguiculata]|uniref:Uncharacterized protein n=1 Tax=Vigna unguiculata TaxID=3917 RepID=A0A4D6N2F7_VIGUN|nr:hypothetical protein DEO72_LG9g1256 [Vigna unguiculata]